MWLAELSGRLFLIAAGFTILVVVGLGLLVAFLIHWRNENARQRGGDIVRRSGVVSLKLVEGLRARAIAGDVRAMKVLTPRVPPNVRQWP